jgi:hypothetical protein
MNFGITNSFCTWHCYVFVWPFSCGLEAENAEKKSWNGGVLWAKTFGRNSAGKEKTNFRILQQKKTKTFSLHFQYIPIVYLGNPLQEYLSKMPFLEPLQKKNSKVLLLPIQFFKPSLFSYFRLPSNRKLLNQER